MSKALATRSMSRLKKRKWADSAAIGVADTACMWSVLAWTQSAPIGAGTYLFPGWRLTAVIQTGSGHQHTHASCANSV